MLHKHLKQLKQLKQTNSVRVRDPLPQYTPRGLFVVFLLRREKVEKAGRGKIGVGDCTPRNG